MRMEYPYDDDCWLPEWALPARQAFLLEAIKEYGNLEAEQVSTHLSNSLLEAIKRGKAEWDGETLHVKLPYHKGRLPNILGEE